MEKRLGSVIITEVVLNKFTKALYLMGATAKLTTVIKQCLLINKGTCQWQNMKKKHTENPIVDSTSDFKLFFNHKPEILKKVRK